MKKKYVDDLSLLESINLKATLIPAPPIIGPPNLHEQPGLVLPADQSVLQHQLADLLVFTNDNKMKINFKKTKIIPFNTTKKYDFLPQLTWTAHVNDITSRATGKLWVLVRFKTLGGSTDQLLKVFQTRVHSTLEFAAPVFHSGLTQDQSRQIESVQKKAFAIILGRSYNSYEMALLTLKQERLDKRRLNLSLKFALKCTMSSKHKHMFPANTNYRPNMRNPKPYLEHTCHTSRYFSSPIPSLARLLNKHSRSTSQ